MERIWGGRALENTYQRELPHPSRPFGESWEIVDRENEQSIVGHGPFAGKSLHELWTQHREEIFGSNLPNEARFPILLKILDARDDLSIQVHPPAELAPSLNGEPKTEMWFIADCDPGSILYVGLKDGVTRQAFENALTHGTVAELVHGLQPRAGESIFIPSGRLHAIGSGFLIHEIQQNSDTTYRVFDWNRLDLDGKPRDLHVEQSMASIDFGDFTPAMDSPDGNVLASCPYFHTELLELAPGFPVGNPNPDRFSILSIVSGQIRSDGGSGFGKGDSLLLPKGARPLTAASASSVLRITLPG
jgi:mannose-6-phosphate isomerase